MFTSFFGVIALILLLACPVSAGTTYTIAMTGVAPGADTGYTLWCDENPNGFDAFMEGWGERRPANPSLNDAGQFVFSAFYGGTGMWLDDGLWSGSAGNIRHIAQGGADDPGPDPDDWPEQYSFDGLLKPNPHIDAIGNVVFVGMTKRGLYDTPGPAIPSNPNGHIPKELCSKHVIWETDGATIERFKYAYAYQGFGGVRMAKSGDRVYTVTMTSVGGPAMPEIPENDNGDIPDFHGTWVNEERVAWHGDSVPGISGALYNISIVYAEHRVNDNAQIVTSMYLQRGVGPVSDTDYSNDKAIFFGSTRANMQKVMWESEVSPIADVFFGQPYTRGFNNAGHVLFESRLTGNVKSYSNGDPKEERNNVALFRWAEGSGATVVVRTGTNYADIGTGVVFTNFWGSGVLNGQDKTAFRAELSGSNVTAANDWGVYIEDGSGNFTEVAREGGIAPGLGGSVPRQ